MCRRAAFPLPSKPLVQLVLKSAGAVVFTRGGQLFHLRMWQSLWLSAVVLLACGCVGDYNVLRFGKGMIID